MDGRITSQYLLMVLFTAALVCLQNVGSVRPKLHNCPNEDPQCPLNLDNTQYCLEQSPEKLKSFHDNAQEDGFAIICDRGMMENARKLELADNTMPLSQSLWYENCSFAIWEIEISYHIERAMQTVLALDGGRIRLRSRTEWDKTVSYKFNYHIEGGRGMSVLIAWHSNDSQVFMERIIQCSYSTESECLNQDLYQRCRASALTPGPTIQQPVDPTTTTTTSTYTSTASPVDESKTQLPTPQPSPYDNKKSSQQPTPRPTPNDNKTSSVISSMKPPSSVKPSTAPGRPSKKKAGNPAILWQTLFLFVGLVAGVLSSVIVIFMLVKCKAYRARRNERLKNKDNAFDLIQNPERIPTQELKDDGYEVPRKTSDGHRESLYTTIEDQEVKL